MKKSLISYPNAKINLGLNIVKRRKDGYHNIETVFYPIPLQDKLQITINDVVSIEEENSSLNAQDKPIIQTQEDNLVIKAYRLLEKDFSLKPIKFKLQKNIPCGAGMGGGSSDAAFTLKMLNEMFELKLNVDQLEKYATVLGADCAFFIKNKPAFAEGIGNLLTPISLNLKNYYLLVVKPNIFISTKEAYAHIEPACPVESLFSTIREEVFLWKYNMINDFETSIFPQYPTLKEIKDNIYRLGAEYAAMSGSGSSLFGIFNKPIEENVDDLFKDYFCQKFKLSV